MRGRLEKPRRRRVRRTPEEARALILGAAERVFAEHLPDVVGLKDIAKEAGVSHALVTHYFGTYDALVEATLEKRFHALRDRLLPTIIEMIAAEADVTSMLAVHRRAIREAASDPTTIRLATWALLSRRAEADDFFPHRMQGLKLLADALESRSKAPRDDLEFALVASFALAAVWTFARRAFAGALGRRPSQALDEGFEERAQRMIDAFLRSS
jgi:TetR/AcrR family transcriptional regulator, repressor for neighboring sulfatase